MDAIFPFGFPFPTAWYLVLYVVTLSVHVVFMNYVLAGSGYLAIASLVGIFSRKTISASEPETFSPIFNMVRDWLPFALSAAITAGIAPLLFLQILYQENFYTANLLLLHRWMAILPVLIVAFYLLYILKSKAMLQGTHRVLRFATALLIFLCFVFTAWSWTENHLLSMDRAVWTSFYGEKRWWYYSRVLIPRLLLWAVGSIPMFCALAGIQLYLKRKSNDIGFGSEAIRRSFVRLAQLAIAGIVLTVFAGGWYWSASGGVLREAVTGRAGRVYFLSAMVFVLVGMIIWLRVMILARDGVEAGRGILAILFASASATILCMSVVRELIRLQTIDISRVYKIHEQASKVGGFWMFLFFAIVNIVVVMVCIRLARRAIKRGDSGSKN